MAGLVPAGTSQFVIPAKEVVKKSIVSAMFSEHLRFNSESNSDQLKNKSHDRPFLHKLESRETHKTSVTPTKEVVK
jgi:hypothetical protein